jgi:hypothetical protein
MRGLYSAVGFWLGVVLGALTLVNLLARGLGVALHGYPQILYGWYKLVFHGLFDVLVYPLGIEAPVWVKDLFAAYLIAGFIVLRALAIHGGLTWIDELAGTDFRESMLSRFSRSMTARVRLPGWVSLSPTTTVVLGSALVLVAWPVLVPMLYREWTRDADNARRISEEFFQSFRAGVFDQDGYERALRTLERAADADSEMYMGYMERNAFMLALSLSANFTILAAIATFTWSEISIQPPA